MKKAPGSEKPAPGCGVVAGGAATDGGSMECSVVWASN